MKRLSLEPARRGSLPGPAPHPIAGSLGNAVRFSRDIIGHATALFDEFGPLVGLVGGDLSRRPALARWVLVHGAELYREVATRQDDFHKPPLTKQLYPRGDQLSPRRKALQRWGGGLFGLNGEAHKETRRVMMPLFHKSHVERCRADIAALTEEELQRWQPGSIVDVRQRMQELTFRIITRCLLGEAVNESEGSLGYLIQRALGLLLSPWVFLFPFDVPGLPFSRLLDAVQQTDLAARRLIQERRREGATERDLVSMLLQAQEHEGEILTDDRIIEHTSVTFIAGHETTANALMWTLLLLSQHPRVAADLLDELDGVLRGSAPTIEQLARLPFLQAVIHESMRILPPVPMNARVAACDTELCGHALPAGTQLLISLFHTHRCRDVFERPSVFNPYRWETCKPATFEFNPFGTGPRTCIGAAFATTELKIVLAILVQRFRLELLLGTRVDRSVRITLSVKGGLPMKVHSQDRQFSRGVGGLRGNVREMFEPSIYGDV